MAGAAERGMPNSSPQRTKSWYSASRSAAVSRRTRRSCITSTESNANAIVMYISSGSSALYGVPAG